MTEDASNTAKLAGPNTLLGRAHDMLEIERAVADAEALDAVDEASSLGLPRIEMDGGDDDPGAPAPWSPAGAGAIPALGVPPLASSDLDAPAPRAIAASELRRRGELPLVASTAMADAAPARAPSSATLVLLAVLAGVALGAGGLAAFLALRG